MSALVVLLMLLLAPQDAAPATQPAVDPAVGQSAAEAAPLQAPAPAPGLPTAVAAYRAGRYAEASQAFAQLAEAEPDAARAGVLHCNAGTAAARAEHFGEALWQLRRARMALPRDPQTEANLERVQAMLASSGAPPAATAVGDPAASDAPQVARTLRELPLHLTLAETAAACSLAAGLALLLLAGWRAGRLPRPAVGLALLLLAASGGWWLFARTAWERESHRAVVIEAVVNGRAEPADASEILFRLPAGAVVSDEEQRGDWRLVQSDSGARGWVAATQVRPLR